MAKFIACLLSLLFMFIFFPSTATADYNVLKFGARPDGRTDSTKSFLSAWAAACNSVRPAKIYIPRGRYLIKQVVFSGPCKSRIIIQIDGTIVAPSDYRALGNTGYWLLFIKVSGVSVYGGTLDGQGKDFWSCRTLGRNCPVGTRSITFNNARNIIISGLTSINSQLTHININGCNNVMVRRVKIIAPDQSPNTDGIHVQFSTGVSITGASIKTGDDCVSIGPGTKNLSIENVGCGPGHGISIGSLAKDLNEEGVEDVIVRNVVFTGTDNGLRIKSWARPRNGFVRGIIYQNIVMNNVKNPIVIDQMYCPGDDQGCPHQYSGIKISQVTYQNIRGTSATPLAVQFHCSVTNPCRGIVLNNINLTYMNQPSQSYCMNADGTASGFVMPKSCL